MENIIKESNVYSKSKKGRQSIPIIYMIKILFLQYLYSLSDPQNEDALIDRLSFRRFVGISFDEEVPDFTTIWRFRERLSRHGLDKRIFEEVVAMLDKKGLILRKGTLVNATIVEASRRPESKDENKESFQKDNDAQFIQKGKHVYFGYKGHVGVDYISGIIRKAEFTPANVHDSKIFLNLLNGDEASVFGDKAYDRIEWKKSFRDMGVYYGILNRGRRSHPLSDAQKKKKKIHSRIRGQVEYVFAYWKHHLGYRVVRYVNYI